MPTYQELENIDVEKRDEKWLHEYMESISNVGLKLLSDQPQQGPDGFSYLLVSPEGDEKLEDLVQWGADKGIGLAINPQKEIPDLVLTFGMLWNYLTEGEFLSPVVHKKDSDILLSDQEEVLTGAPNESFWPPRGRALFKEFLMAQGIMNGRVVLILQEDNQADLCFSLESLGTPPESEWEGVLEGFSWFFPRHYSLAIVSEKNLPGAPFTAV